MMAALDGMIAMVLKILTGLILWKDHNQEYISGYTEKKIRTGDYLMDKSLEGSKLYEVVYTEYIIFSSRFTAKVKFLANVE